MDFLQGLPSWVRLLVIGLVAGWLAAVILKEKKLGLLGYLVVGVVGSFVGYYLFSAVGLAGHGLFYLLGAALVGAILLILLLRLIKRE